MSARVELLGRATWAVLVAGVLPTLATLSACGDDETDTAETGADDVTSASSSTTGEETAADTTTAAPSDDTACAETPQLYLVNNTGNVVEEITMIACDMSEQSSYPVPGGLPDATELTIDLPGPGCWLLGYSGEGCFSDMPVMVEAACGEMAEWALLPENHVCAGG